MCLSEKRFQRLNRLFALRRFDRFYETHGMSAYSCFCEPKKSSCPSLCKRTYTACGAHLFLSCRQCADTCISPRVAAQVRTLSPSSHHALSICAAILGCQIVAGRIREFGERLRLAGRHGCFGWYRGELRRVYSRAKERGGSRETRLLIQAGGRSGFWTQFTG